MTVTRRPRKLRRPSSLGEVGWPRSLALAPSTSRKPSLSPTLTGSIYHRFTATGLEGTQSLGSAERRGRSTSPKHVFEARPLPTAYASLPPSPTLRPRPSTPPPSILPIPQSSYADVQPQPGPPFSLWDYLREELLATDFDSHQELKWERVRNFLNIPLAMEKVGTTHPHFYPHSLINPLQDNRLWIHLVLRFFPIHFYNSSYSLCLGAFSICL